jgi:hypothetical protein
MWKVLMKEYKADFECFEVSWLAISSIILQKPWKLCLIVVGQHDAKMGGRSLAMAIRRLSPTIKAGHQHVIQPH